MFQIDLPKENERREILKLILKNENLASDVDLGEIAKRTEEYSGSDLKDLCRRAAMKGLKELTKSLCNSSRYGASSLTPSSTSVDQSVYVEQILSNQQDPSSSSSSTFNQSTLRSPNDQIGLTSSKRYVLARFESSDPRITEPRSITMDDFCYSIESIDTSRNGIKPKKSRIPLD